MKKTLTINLNKKVFHIDEDAYSLLNNYLLNLRNYFRKEPEVEEVMNDFEGRIEELLSEKMKNGIDVVSIPEVENVIRQLGNPSDFGVESPDDKSDYQSFTNNRQRTDLGTGKKKFYRDPNNKFIGGVCSGISAYLDWDVTWVRLGMILLFFVGLPLGHIIFASGWLIILYIALWIVIPAAKTAEQKLEMSGEPITVKNIGIKVAEQANMSVSNHSNNNGCLGLFLKVFLILLAITIGIPLLFVLAVMLIALYAVLFKISIDIPGLSNGCIIIQRPEMAVIGSILFIGIPLIALIYTAISSIFKWEPLHKSIKLTTAFVWIVSIFLLLFSGWKIDRQGLEHWGKHPRFWSKRGLTWMRFSKEINNVKRTKNFPEVIKELEIRGNINIKLEVDNSAGNSSSMTIEGDSDIVNDCLNIEREGKKLVLKSTAMKGIWQSQQCKLALQTPDLVKIHLVDAASLECSGLSASNFSINATSASSLKLPNANIQNLLIACFDASNATLTGKAPKAVLRAKDASHIFADELVSDTIQANASSASTIQCNPVLYLDANSSEASSITYKSEPESKTVNEKGF